MKPETIRIDTIEKLLVWMCLEARTNSIVENCEDGSIGRFISFAQTNGYRQRILKAINDPEYLEHLMSQYPELNIE